MNLAFSGPYLTTLRLKAADRLVLKALAFARASRRASFSAANCSFRAVFFYRASALTLSLYLPWATNELTIPLRSLDFLTRSLHLLQAPQRQMAFLQLPLLI